MSGKGDDKFLTGSVLFRQCLLVAKLAQLLVVSTSLLAMRFSCVKRENEKAAAAEF